MALTRTSPLLTTAAQVAALVTLQGLANLEAGGQVSVAGTLLVAHAWVFDRLKRRFSTAQLLTLSNSEELERAVAYRFVELVAAGGHLVLPPEQSSPDYWAAQAKDEVDGFQPEWSDDADSPRASIEGIPRVVNITSSHRGPLFGGQLS